MSGPSIVQHVISPVSGNAASGTSFSLGFASAVTLGNSVVGALMYGQIPGDSNIPQIQTITDDKSNNYPVDFFEIDATHTFSEWASFHLDHVSGGPKTLTFSYGAGNSLPVGDAVAVMVEIGATSGADVWLANLQGNPGTSTDGVTSGPFNTNGADLIIGFTGTPAGNTLSITAGTNFTQLDLIGNAASTNHLMSEFFQQTAAASGAATWTNNLNGTNVIYGSFAYAFLPLGPQPVPFQGLLLGLWGYLPSIEVAADIGSAAESAHGVASDSNAPVEALARPSVDSGAPLEELTHAAADSDVPAEDLRRVGSDSGAPAEETARAGTDIAVPAEALAGVAVDRGVPLESLAAALTKVFGDCGIPLEIITAVMADRGVPSESLKGVAADSGATAEFRGGVASDSSAPAETMARAAADRGVPAEALGGVAADRGTPAEFLSGVARDNPVLAEWLAHLSQDTVALFQLAAAVLANAGPALEALKGVGRDLPAPAETLAGLAADLGLPIEALAAFFGHVLGDSGLPLEIGIRLVRKIVMTGDAIAQSRLVNDAIAQPSISSDAIVQSSTTGDKIG